jgi:glycosyltransferase involved in cell wall biosynthesis
LVEAFQEWGAKHDQWQLRIIGKNLDPDYFALMEKARRAGPCSDRIHFESEIPYAEIHRVYASAGLFVFPSILETFGHPLLEAMASGLPVVAADMPVSREICGEYAAYFDWDDSRDCARALDEALEAPRVVPDDYFESRGFTWDRSADRTLEVIRELLGGG